MPKMNHHIHATIDSDTKTVMDGLANELQMSKSELIRESLATVHALRKQRARGRDIVVAEGNELVTDLHFLPILRLGSPPNPPRRSDMKTIAED